jgi:hypothetical protein
MEYNENEAIVENEDELEASHSSGDVYPMQTIKVSKGFYSVYELKRKFDRKDRGIVLDSNFQREDVWNQGQKSELIESVLMGLPLPIFYFNEDKKGRLIVVDGRQRLTALFEFIDCKFKLGDLKIMNSLSKKKFSDLDEIDKQRIEDYQLYAHLIQPPTPDRIKFDIFDRVNRGGTRLNKQEMRNALYQGQSTLMLNRLKDLPEFRIATEYSFDRDTRMKNRYILLRFLAFHLYFNEELFVSIKGQKKLYEYKGDIDEMLGLTMEYFNSLSDEEIASYEMLTLNALKNVNYYMPANAFRLTETSDGKLKRYPININIFETVMYAMSLLPHKNKDLKKYIHSSFVEMKESETFRDSIYNHRDSNLKVEVRHRLITDIIKGAKSDD